MIPRHEIASFFPFGIKFHDNLHGGKFSLVRIAYDPEKEAHTWEGIGEDERGNEARLACGNARYLPIVKPIPEDMDLFAEFAKNYKYLDVFQTLFSNHYDVYDWLKSGKAIVQP